MLKKISGLTLLLLAMLPLRAQYPEIEANMKAFPGENGVISFASEYFEIKNVKSGISIEARYEKRSSYFNDNANLYASSEIGYSDFYLISDIEAYSLVPENGKYSRKDVKEFRQSNAQGDYVFFDDNKTTSFYFPNLAKNAQSVLKYNKTCNDPHLLPRIFLSSYLPVAHKEVEICYDAGVTIAYRMYNCDSLNIKVDTYTKGNKNYLKWTADNVPKTSVEDGAPGLLHQMPHIVFYINSYQQKDSLVNVLNNSDDFYRWTYGFFKEALEEDYGEVKLFSDSLCAGLTSSTEKIKKTYSWVQDQIRYVAFEEGYSGFKPRSPGLVLSRRYGDCKDMATLLSRMLQYQNIKAYPSLVGTRDLPYKITEAPVTGTFNHVVVVAYDESGTEYILDPTSDKLILPYPSQQIQGKELMLCIDANQQRVITAPVMDKTASAVHTTLTMDLSDDRTITGNGVYSLGGYFGIMFREYYAQFKDDEKVKLVKANIAHGNNKLKLENLTYSSLGNKEEPLENRFHFTLPDYTHRNNDEVYVNLNISKDLLNKIEMKDRKYDLENDFKYIVYETFILNIPEAYELRHLPADAHFEGSVYGYNFHYSSQGSQVVLERTIYVDYLLIRCNEIPDWNLFVKDLNANCSETVVLVAKPK